MFMQNHIINKNTQVLLMHLKKHNHTEISVLIYVITRTKAVYTRPECWVA